MKFLIFILLVTFPLGQLARFNVVNSEIVLHLNDVIAGLTVGFYFFKNYKKIFADKLFRPLVFVVLTMAVSLVVNAFRLNLFELLSSAAYLVRFGAYAGLYFVAKDYPLLKRGLLLGIILVAIAGLIQYMFVPDVSFLAAFDWDDHYYRLVSTFLDPGFTGIILLVGLLLSQGVVSQARQGDALQRVSLVILFVSMMLTYSRATYLAYLAAFVVISWYKKSLKIILIASLALGISVMLLPKSSGEGTKLGRENSTWARVNNWKESVAIWQTSPIFGVGYNAYRYSRTATSLQSHSGAGADSSLLLALATTGVVGLFFYLYLLKSVFVVIKHNPILVAVSVAILVHSWFNNTLFYPWVMETLWVLLAAKDYT